MVDVKVGDPDPTPNLDDDLTRYCWTPCRLTTPARTVYCSWPAGHQDDHVGVLNRKVAAVYAGSDLLTGRVWAPRDRKPWVMGPTALGIDEADWTDQMIREGAKTGVNRQCSIGWHGECSDPEGERCKCACHAFVGAEDEDEYIKVPLGALRELVESAQSIAYRADQEWEGGYVAETEKLVAALGVDELDED